MKLLMEWNKKIMDYSLRFLEEEDSDIILKWRNSERVRTNMLNDNKIKTKDHQIWFQKVREKHLDYYLIFSIDKISTGLVSFKDHSLSKDNCIWGIYIGEINAPKGAGTLLGYIGIEYAFNRLKFKKIYAEVISTNIPSIKLHEKLGFSKDEFFQKEISKQGKLVEVYRYTISQESWLERKKTIKVNLNGKEVDVSDLSRLSRDIEK